MSATDGTAHVASAETSRTFVWTSDDRRRVVTGEVGAGETEVRLDSAATLHTYTVRFSAAPAPLICEVKSPLSSWTWTWPKPVPGQVEVRHPANATALVLRADGYKPVELRLFEDTGLGTIYLYRYPILTGTVIDARTSLPVAGAEVTLPSDKTAATTDGHGRFRAVIDGAWPATIRVAAAGRAATIVPVPKAVTDTDLPPISLHNGGSVDVQLLPPLSAETDRLSWQLRRVVSPSKSEAVREGKVTAGQTEYSIDGVEAGSYLVFVQGEGPLQRLGLPVRVNDGQVSHVKMQIRPAVLDLVVRYGPAPLTSATVIVEHNQAQWSGVLRTDDSGHAAEELWQGGDISLIVSSVVPPIPGWVHDEEISGEGRIPLELHVPFHTIRGRVLDSATGAPIGGARLSLAVWADGRRGMTVGGMSSADGTYEFAGAGEGDHSIAVYKDGYRRGRVVPFPVGEKDDVVDQDVFVDPTGYTRILQVISSSGVPIPSAAVILFTQRGMQEMGTTGADGRLAVPFVTPQETGRLFAVPPSGSFGSIQVTPPADGDDGSFTLRIPDGSAALSVIAQSISGDVVPRVGLFMRVDGLMIPPTVLELLTNLQGASIRSDENGRLTYPHMPPGRYELWPVMNKAQAQVVYSLNAPPAPVSIALTAGEQSVILKFEPKRSSP